MLFNYDAIIFYINYLPVAATMPYTEGELIDLLKKKDRNCFDCLYDQYATSLYNTILKIVKSEEVACAILHNTFLRIWQNAESIETANQKLYTWMLGNARLAVADVLQGNSVGVRAYS